MYATPATRGSNYVMELCNVPVYDGEADWEGKNSMLTANVGKGNVSKTVRWEI